MKTILWAMAGITFSLFSYQKHLDYLYPSQDYTSQESVAYVLDENLLVTHTQWIPHANMIIVYPQLSGLSDTQVEDNINQLIKKIFTENELVHHVRTDLKTIESYRCEGGIKKINDLLIVTRNDFVRSIGAAHGMPAVTVFHIDSRTGQQYSLQDLFKENIDFKHQLTVMTKKKIAHEFPHVNEKNPPVENFIISRTGFKIFFQPYEIDCFAAGFPAIKIYYSEIDSLLNKSGLFYRSFHMHQEQEQHLFWHICNRFRDFFYHIFCRFIIT